MEVVKDMLMQREADYQALDSKRLEYLWYILCVIVAKVTV